MKLRLLFAVLFAVLFAALFSVSAHALELKGNFEQGGMVSGRVQAGSKVSLDGRAVAVSARGDVVFGFGRDAKAKAVLSVKKPNGQVETRRFTITPRTYKIQRINGLPRRQVSPRAEDIKRILADNTEIRAVRALRSAQALFLKGFIWPVKGPISGVFGSQRILDGKPKNPHNGVDIAAPWGTPIVAPADGVVALVAPNMFYTGKTVMIDHGLGLSTVYAHMSSIAVVAGQKVKQGERIGTVGRTGRVTGAHLHWGLTWKNIHLDPELVVGAMPPR